MPSAAPILTLSNLYSKNSFDTTTSLSTFFSIDRFKSTVDSPCLIEMPETMRQLRREYWYKLSNSAESLSLVFWLTYSVDSRTITLFLRVSTLFSSQDIFPWSTSTSSFNSETSLLDFDFISVFGDSNCLAEDFSTFLPTLLYILLYKFVCYTFHYIFWCLAGYKRELNVDLVSTYRMWFYYHNE